MAHNSHQTGKTLLIHSLTHQYSHSLGSSHRQALRIKDNHVVLPRRPHHHVPRHLGPRHSDMSISLCLCVCSALSMACSASFASFARLLSFLSRALFAKCALKSPCASFARFSTSLRRNMVVRTLALKYVPYRNGGRPGCAGRRRVESWSEGRSWWSRRSYSRFAAVFVYIRISERITS